MEVKSTDTKTLQLTENGQQLGELIYENLFSLKAEIKLTNSDLYEVYPVGVFGTSITVTKNGTEIANLKMNWRGQIVFSFQDGQEFVLKAKGIFFHNKYILENWGWTLKHSSAVHIQASYSADGILPGSSSKHRLLVINLASVPGGQLVNSPTAQSLDSYLQPLKKTRVIIRT